MSEEPNSADSPRRLGMGMVVAMWVIVLGLLTAYFSHWQDSQVNPNQAVNTISRDGGINEVVLKRNRYGHYVTAGAINDVPVVFMLDTGASDISVPKAIADRIGLEPGPSVNYETANGSARAYLTRLQKVSIGGITLYDVRASINPNYQADEILLGMTFLKHLEFTQKGDSLTLRQYP